MYGGPRSDKTFFHVKPALATASWARGDTSKRLRREYREMKRRSLSYIRSPHQLPE